MTSNVFVGFDEREAEVFHVCVQSIIDHASAPFALFPLSFGTVSNLYQGGMRDGSNAFVYTRFLCPFISKFNGWSVFLDGDMVLRNDLHDIFEFCDDSKAVFVVKHDYKTKAKVKYLGAPNEDYPRKNWSSVILWNNAHEKNRILTPEVVAQRSGKFLHRFEWLNDEDIGELPIDWNWLPDEFGENPDAKLLHYTLGSPCFPEYSNTPMAEHYFRTLMNVNRVDRIW